MESELVTTRRASCTSRHSVWWISRESPLGSQPWCRPGGVHGRDDRDAEVVAQPASRVADHPVVRVHDVGTPHQGGPGSREGEVEPGDPVEDLVGADPQRVVGRAQHADALDDLVRDRVGPAELRDHHDVVARVCLRDGERVHVVTEPAVDERRVLPRHVQHAHVRSPPRAIVRRGGRTARRPRAAGGPATPLPRSRRARRGRPAGARRDGAGSAGRARTARRSPS